MSGAPEDWVLGPTETPGSRLIIIKWGTIFTSLIGAPLAAWGIGLTNIPLAAGQAISGGLNAIGTTIESLIAAFLGSIAWLIGEQAREAATGIEGSGIGAFLAAVLIGGATLYGVATAYEAMTGGGV